MNEREWKNRTLGCIRYRTDVCDVRGKKYTIRFYTDTDETSQGKDKTR
jgi:hypothetical protein